MAARGVSGFAIAFAIRTGASHGFGCPMWRELTSGTSDDDLVSKDAEVACSDCSRNGMFPLQSRWESPNSKTTDAVPRFASHGRCLPIAKRSPIIVGLEKAIKNDVRSASAPSRRRHSELQDPSTCRVASATSRHGFAPWYQTSAAITSWDHRRRLAVCEDLTYRLLNASSGATLVGRLRSNRARLGEA